MNLAFIHVFVICECSEPHTGAVNGDSYVATF